MNTAEIFAKVQEILVNELDVSGNLVDMDLGIRSDLVADDSVLLDILLDLEETFDVDIPDPDFAELDTVGDVVEYIKNALD